MTVNIPDDFLPLVVRALEHYHAYTHATQREDARYLQAAELFKRKPAGSEEGTDRTAKRKRG